MIAGAGAGSVLRCGNSNISSANFSAVLAGQQNTTTALNSTISGGEWNKILNNGCCSIIGGGQWNTMNNRLSVISGGEYNTASGYCSFIGGGSYNKIYPSIDGRQVITGGQNNTITENSTGFIGGGGSNTINSAGAVIVGGGPNTNSSPQGFIGGGNTNTILGGVAGVLIGGRKNTTNGNFSTVSGGYCNTIVAEYSGILGGCKNTIPSSNVRSFIIGNNITVNRQCTTFVNNLSIVNIPTSASGLPTGAVWRDPATNGLFIVP
jgi:hypothetical protein